MSVRRLILSVCQALSCPSFRELHSVSTPCWVLGGGETSYRHIYPQLIFNIVTNNNPIQYSQHQKSNSQIKFSDWKWTFPGKRFLWSWAAINRNRIKVILISKEIWLNLVTVKVQKLNAVHNLLQEKCFNLTSTTIIERLKVRWGCEWNFQVVDERIL